MADERTLKLNNKPSKNKKHYEKKGMRIENKFP